MALARPHRFRRTNTAHGTVRSSAVSLSGLSGLGLRGKREDSCFLPFTEPRTPLRRGQTASRTEQGVALPGRRTVNTKSLPGSLATVTSPPIMRARRQGPARFRRSAARAANRPIRGVFFVRVPSRDVLHAGHSLHAARGSKRSCSGHRQRTESDLNPDIASQFRAGHSSHVRLFHRREAM